MNDIGASAQPRPSVRTLADDWTIVTRDGALSAHMEHTVAITDRGPVTLAAA